MEIINKIILAVLIAPIIILSLNLIYVLYLIIKPIIEEIFERKN